jgi:hypothetical protein
LVEDGLDVAGDGDVYGLDDFAGGAEPGIANGAGAGGDVGDVVVAEERGLGEGCGEGGEVFVAEAVEVGVGVVGAEDDGGDGELVELAGFPELAQGGAGVVEGEEDIESGAGEGEELGAGSWKLEAGGRRVLGECFLVHVITRHVITDAKAAAIAAWPSLLGWIPCGSVASMRSSPPWSAM